jgi:hypothetical protein
MSPPPPLPCYFLARTRNNPPDGLIKLGNLIGSPDLPDEPLPLASPLPIINITSHIEEGWSYNVGKKTDVSTSLGVSFLELLLGAGGDAGVSWLRDNSQEWTCERTTVLEFKPSEAWLASLVTDTRVREVLTKRSFWKRDKRFYIVVGIKIAVGASMASTFARSMGLHLHASVDLTPATGIPISANTDSGLSYERHRSEKVGTMDDFIIGYRLRRLKISRKSVVKKNEQYNDGAAFGEDEGDDGAEEEDLSIVVDELESHDTQGADVGMKTAGITGDDGSTIFMCVKTGVLDTAE